MLFEEKLVLRVSELELDLFSHSFGCSGVSCYVDVLSHGFRELNFRMELLYCLPTRKRDPFNFSLHVILGELFGFGVKF